MKRGRLETVIDDETRPLLEAAKRAAAEVANWPAWKRNELPREETAVKPGGARRARNRRARNANERELLEASLLHQPSTAAVNAQLQTPEAWRALWADCTPEPRR